MGAPAPLVLRGAKMAVILFKEGGSQKFDEYTFTDRLAEGWRLEEQPEDSVDGSVDIIHTPCGEKVEDCMCPGREVLVVSSQSTLRKNNTFPGYGMGSGPNAAEWLEFDKPEPVAKAKPVKKLSNKAVRKAAKKAGIKDHAKARIKSLRKALSL